MDVRESLIVDSVAIVIALVALGSELVWKQRGNDYLRRFRALLICICLILVADILTWLFDGRSFEGARALCYGANTLCYALQIIFCWFWMRFVYDWSKGFRAASRARRLAFAVPVALEIAVLAWNLFTGGVFYMDGANRYRRGAGYGRSLIPFVAYIAAAFAILIRPWLTAADADRKRHSVTLIVGSLLPACGSVIETRNFNVSLTWPLAALSLLLIYLSAQQEQNALDKAEAAGLRAALAESRMSIMLSQIQPHFLYNSLSVISELCETDPKKARYATTQFSDFLRGNMNSLTMSVPIAFERELLHTKNYLALEQLRFPDRLKTVLRIGATQFCLPTLTLQPIVENAVRYGVTKRPEGGTVTIETRETPQSYVVTVSDDGLGFDPMLPKADGRTHIGITNVRDRLERMVNGTLVITSIPDAGTVAVITIPKGALPC